MFLLKGIRAVGVDAIAIEAGSNKMRFYRNFASKDELVVQYLRKQEQEYWAWWDAAIAPHAGDSRRQLKALVGAHAEKYRCVPAWRCALGNAAIELRGSGHPGFAIVRGCKAKMRERLRRLAHDAGARNPGDLGDSLQLIMEGGYHAQVASGESDGPLGAFASLAISVLDLHLKQSKVGRS